MPQVEMKMQAPHAAPAVVDERDASAASPGRVDVAVVILTYNEEPNLYQPLQSVRGWAKQIFVFDSFSSDRTIEIARHYGADTHQHKFVDYAAQRNAALDRLPIEVEWVLMLDADEWLPDEVKAEIEEILARGPEENAFFIKRRLIWLGKWIRRGIYPTWCARLFRFKTARYDSRAVNEHLNMTGATGRLQHDFMHEDRKTIGDWIAKHNRYSTMEAAELFNVSREGQIKERLFGTQQERVRWIRANVWEKLPPLVRPFFYFTYRYIFRGGFLDGKAGFAYHFLHALWFPMLIDIKYVETRFAQKSAEPGANRG